MKNWLLRKKIEYDLKREEKQKVVKKGIKAQIKQFFTIVWKIFKKICFTIYRPLKIFNKMPFIIIFIIFLGFMLTGIFMANKLMFKFWSNTVVAACPEISQGQYDEEGQVVQISPIDMIMAEFTAKSISSNFSQTGLLLFSIVAITLSNFRPRKPQVFYSN